MSTLRVLVLSDATCASLKDEELIVFFNKNCTKLGISNPVDAVRVVRDSASQLGKGFGFVQFSDQAAARAALGCDGQLLRKRAIRITKAVKVPAHLKDLGKGNPGKNAVGKNASERKPAGGLCASSCSMPACLSCLTTYQSSAVNLHAPSVTALAHCRSPCIAHFCHQRCWSCKPKAVCALHYLNLLICINNEPLLAAVQSSATISCSLLM